MTDLHGSAVVADGHPESVIRKVLGANLVRVLH